MTAEARCKNPKCNRVLRAAKSIATGYGPTCAKKVKADNADYTPEQTAKAFRVIQGGGVTRIPSKHFRLYAVQGTYRTYETDGIDCTCRGAAEHGACYHALAARLFEAAQRAERVARRYGLAA